MEIRHEPADPDDFGTDVEALAEAGAWIPALTLFERSWIDRWYNTDPSLLRKTLAAVPPELLREYPGAYYLAVLTRTVVSPPNWDVSAHLMYAARTAGDDEQLLYAYSVQAAEYRMDGRMRDAMACLASGAPVLRRLESSIVDTSDGFVPFMRLQYGITALLAGDFVAARGWLRSSTVLRASQRLPFMQRAAAVRLALACVLSGQVDEAGSWLAQAANAPRTKGWMEDLVNGAELIAEQLLAVEALDLAKAQSLLGVHYAPSQYGEMWPFAFLARIQFLLLQGNQESALNLCEETAASNLPGATGDGVAAALVPTARAACHLARGEVSIAWSVLSTATIPSPYVELYRAKTLYCAGAFERAAQLANDGLRARSGQIWITLGLLGVVAAAKYNLGDRQAARDSIVELCRLAEAQKLTSYLIALPPSVLDEFADIPAVAHGLARLRQDSVAMQLPDPVITSPFTERESLVVELLLQGYKRDEIAAQLFVSVATVKSQIRSSYAKLGVTSGPQAIAKLQSVQLTPVAPSQARSAPRDRS